MAHGAVAIAVFPRWPGWVAAAVVVGLCLGTLIPLGFRADGAGGLAPADWVGIRFTVSQAAVSAFVSVMLAIPVARALARRRFAGRSVVTALLGAPFILPTVVAVLGLLTVFGRQGILNSLLTVSGLPPITIYGFHGVVLAHVFFNMPLATRLILLGWLAIPSERFRVAASLNAPVGRVLEIPMLRTVVPGAFLVIFLVCLTSFAVALMLGGGPRATTVELAIYQALRFDFDPGKAALLALIQFGLCATVALLAWLMTMPDGFGGGLDRTVMRYDGGLPGRITDAIAIGAAVMFLLVPLGAVVLRGVPGLPGLPAEVWIAALRSVGLALVSVALCLVLTFALVIGGRGGANVLGSLPLAASPLVIGTGLFLILFPVIDPASVALPVTALVNAVMSLPFALVVVGRAVRQTEITYGRMATSLGLTGFARLRIVILPRVRRALGFAAGLAAALSMGDLGVMILFSQDGQATLPVVMQRLMAAYRMDAAAAAALVLLVQSFGLFWLFDKSGRIDADS